MPGEHRRWPTTQLILPNPPTKKHSKSNSSISVLLDLLLKWEVERYWNNKQDFHQKPKEEWKQAEPRAKRVQFKFWQTWLNENRKFLLLCM